MTEYFKLPDALSAPELRVYFEEFLRTYDSDCENTSYDLDELLELADRQWHTYEMLDGDMKKQLTNYLLSVINLESEDMMECVLCIVPRLGLGELFEFIEQNCAGIHNRTVLDMIGRCNDEYGKTVNDPYANI